MSEAVQQAICDRLAGAQRILVVTHIRPDGDAMGALLGLGISLLAASKQVQLVSEDGVPANFRFLPGWKRVLTRSKGDFDLVVALDCSDLQRTGQVLDGMGAPSINIDHHITNLNFAQINLVDTSAVATCQIIAENLAAWDLPINPEVASALLTGLITDTLGFRTSNMTPQAMRVVAMLMEAGAELPALYVRALMERSFEAVRLWGAGLGRLEREGPLVWTSLTLQDRIVAGYPGRDDADLVNILSSVQDAAIAVIFSEQPGARVKVSWRSQPGYDVSRLALGFGGGGHPAAAGADISGELAEVRLKVLNATRGILVTQ